MRSFSCDLYLTHKKNKKHSIKKGSSDPFKGLMGGIKTCKKIMNNEFEYVPPQKNIWPSSEKEIIRNENKKVELTRYKGARGHLGYAHKLLKSF